MNRRGFLASVLAAAAAPAIVRSDALMRIVPRDRAVLTLDGSESPIFGGDVGRWDAAQIFTTDPLITTDPLAVRRWSVALALSAGLWPPKHAIPSLEAAVRQRP